MEAVADQSLRFTWDLGGGEPSTVELTLAGDADGGTFVTMTHSGVPAAQTIALSCFWPVSLANLEAHCEGLPTTPPFDFIAPAHEAALARTVIDVPVEEVYASLLNPAEVGKWAGGEAVIEPTVGGRYELGRAEGPSRILELEPEKVIAYSWHHEGGPDTEVRWQLRGARGSTYLTLVHSGFSDDALAERYRMGWPGQLVELKRLLELGARWEPLTVQS